LWSGVDPHFPGHPIIARGRSPQSTNRKALSIELRQKMGWNPVLI
jgi:hypothetical protein